MLASARMGTLWWGGLVLMVVGLVAPFLAVDVPLLADYPNHLARSYILAFGAGDPVLSRIFAARWELTPNLAMDLLVPPLMWVMPPLLAGKLFVAATVLLPATGAVALGRACLGRPSLWHLGAGFIAYNAMFLIGFLNFEFSIGVALWGAAAWIAMDAAEATTRAAIGAAFAMASWLSHFYGFCFFALIVGCHELAWVARNAQARPPRLRAGLRRIVALVAALLVPTVLYLSTTLADTGGPVVWQDPARKLFYLLTPVLAYSRLLAELVTAAIVAPLLFWAVRRRLVVAGLAWIAIPVLLLAYAVLPAGAKGTYWIDTRIPLLIALLLFATVAPVRLGRLEATLATVGLGALFALRMAYVTEIWRASAIDVREARAALAPVTPGSRVLIVEDLATVAAAQRSEVLGPGFPLATSHLGAFALLDRRAYWSGVFAIPGQQPLAVLPPYDRLGGGAVPDYHALQASSAPGYLADWPGKYDFAFLLGASRAAEAALDRYDHLQPVAASGRFALYAVKP